MLFLKTHCLDYLAFVKRKLGLFVSRTFTYSILPLSLILTQFHTKEAFANADSDAIMASCMLGMAGSLDTAAKSKVTGTEMSICQTNIRAVQASAVVGAYLLGAVTFGVGATLASGAITIACGTMVKVSYDAAEKFKVCEPDMTNGKKSGVAPYTDDQIRALIKKQKGSTINPTSSEIKDKYKKICIQADNGKQYWLAKGDCTDSVSGVRVCAFQLQDYEDLLCARVSSACPALANIQFGHTEKPEYKKDSNDSYEYCTIEEAKVSGQCKDRAYSFKYKDFEKEKKRLTHCKLLKSETPVVIPEEDGSIIGQSCRYYTGYSKVEMPFTSYIVQCIEETVRNIFEKELVDKYTAYSKIIFNENQTAVINAMSLIKNMINDPREGKKYATKNEIQNNLASGSKKTKCMKAGGEAFDCISTNPKLSKDLSIPIPTEQSTSSKEDIINSYLFSTSSSNPGIFKPYWSSAATATQITADDLKIIGKSLADEAVKEADKRASEDGSYRTMFQKFQGAITATIMLAMILHISIVGAGMMLGFNLTKTNDYIKYAFKFAIVYYFAIGDAWKDYALNAVLNSTNGIAVMVMESVGNQDGTNTDRCGYMSSPDLEATPYIPQPSYYSPTPLYAYVDGYRQVLSYTKKDDKGNIVKDANGNPTKIAVKPYIYPIPKKATNSGVTADCVVPEGTYMIGYKMEDLIALFKEIPVVSSTAKNNRPTASPESLKQAFSSLGYTTGRVMTSVFVIQVNDTAASLVGDDFNVEIKTGIGDGGFTAAQAADILKKRYRFYSLQDPDNEDLRCLIQSNTNEAIGTNGTSLNTDSYTDYLYNAVNITIPALESIRKKTNLSRQYPQVPTGSSGYRDMRYLGLFDTIDCKLSRYLLMEPGDKMPGVASIIISAMFVPGIGILIAVLCIIITVGVVLSVLRVVHMYIVSLIGLTILIYISPIIIPLSLFSKTEDIFEKWKKKIIGLVLQPGFLFIATALLFRIYDQVLYGSPADTGFADQFNESGTIKPTCTIDKMACMLTKAFKASSNIPGLLGIKFPYINFSGINTGELLLQSLLAIIMIMITLIVLEKVEALISELVEGGGLKSGIDGVAGKTQAAAMSAAKGAAKVQGSAAKKAGQTVARARGNNSGGSAGTGGE